jgi:hypothetical protein
MVCFNSWLYSGFLIVKLHHLEIFSIDPTIINFHYFYHLFALRPFPVANHLSDAKTQLSKIIDFLH